MTLVLVAVVVMAFREPAYLLSPGFYAEEGNVYFFLAWNRPWYRTLFAAPSGYFLLFTNGAALAAAHLAPLRDAPRITTLLALAVQLLPVALIAFSAAPEWGDRWRKLAGVCIVIFASMSHAIWLNTINSQCYFAIVAFLILLEPAELSRRRTLLYGALLALAGLSGPVAASLAPLFVWKAWRTNHRSARLLAVVAAFSLVVQLLVVAATSGGPYMGGRGSEATIFTRAAIAWMRAIVLPLFGANAAERFAAALVATTGGEAGSAFAVGVGAVLVLVASAVLAYLARPLSPEQRIGAVGSFVLATGVVVSLASGKQALFLESADRASRYFYAPGVMLLVLLLLNVRAERSSTARSVATGLLLAIGLTLGMNRYRTAAWQPSWPSWESEVAAWEVNPRHQLRIWPPGWTVLYLTPRRRGALPSRATAPPSLPQHDSTTLGCRSGMAFSGA